MSKSWPYFRRKKCHFSDPKIHTSFQTSPLTNYLDKSSDKNDFLKSISNSYISLSFLLIWNWNDKLDHSVLLFPRKACPIPDQSGDQNSAKTIPSGAAHTYMAYVSEYPPPPAPDTWKVRNFIPTTGSLPLTYFLLYCYMRNFCNLIGLEQWYFSFKYLHVKITTFCG